MKKLIIALVALSLLIAPFTSAATLVYTRNVAECKDYDGGLNFLVSSIIWGRVHSGPASAYIAGEDFCQDNFKVREWSCVKGTPMIMQQWEEDCRAIGKTACVNGRCV